MPDAAIPPIADIFHIRWALTHECPFACSYCKIEKDAADCVTLRPRLMRMAWRALSRPAAFYDIVIGGGEPTLHPYLPDIIRYFLAAPRKLRVTLETAGYRDVAWHLDLGAGAGNELAFAIGAHPSHANPGKLASLLGALAERGHAVSVNLFYDAANPGKSDALRDLLVSLRRVLAFQTNVIAPPQAALWRERSLALLDGEVVAPVAELVFADGEDDTAGAPAQAVADQQNAASTGEIWCAHGANALFITPDGRFQGAGCHMALAGAPLWGDTPLAACQHLVCCDQLDCEHAFMPGFRQRGEAAALLANIAENVRENPPLIDPVTGEPAPGQIFRSRLLRARLPEGVESLPAQERAREADLLKERGTDLFKIYEAMADVNSAAVYLSALRALMAGDARWLAQPVEPRGYAEAADLLAAGPAICLEPSLTPAVVAAHAGDFLRRRALLAAPLDANTASLADALLALLALDPALRLHLALEQPGLLRVIAVPGNFRPAQPPLAPVETRPFLSVIILAGGAEAELMRSVDSALLQGTADLEIIIVDPGSPEQAARRIDDYANLYPRLIRLYRPQALQAADGAAKTPAAGWQAGLALARGQYACLVPCGDMLASDLMALARKEAARSGADIIALGVALARNGQADEIWPAQCGDFDGAEALALYARRKFGPLIAGGRLYRLDFLRGHGIDIAAGGKWAHLALAVRAFYHADWVTMLPATGHYHYAAQAGGQVAAPGLEFVEELADCAAFLNDFFRGLDYEAHNALCLAVYSGARAPFCAALNASPDWPAPGRARLGTALAKLIKSRPFLNLIIGDYATLACLDLESEPTVAAQDLDWRAAAARPDPEVAFSAYADADNPQGAAPLLSVILPNYNKLDYLRPCLKSILSQSFGNFELICVDDASDDGSYEILRDYADADARLRLYRMAENGRQGICRNLGMDKARGRYVIFVDSDDLVEPGFFAHAVKTIANAGADAVFFSLRVLCAGKEKWAKKLAPGVFGPGALFAQFAQGTFSPAPYAKIFNARFLAASGARFAPRIFHQDQFFIIDVVRKARKIVFDPFMAYSMVESRASSIRPASRRYLHVRSCVAFYGFLNEAAGGPGQEMLADHLIWNLEKIFSRACRAFLSARGELPLAEGDYQELQGNYLFAQCLCVGLARLCAKTTIPGGLLASAPAPQLAPTPIAARLAPLVTVIMPVYNQDKLLARAVKSVLRQSLRDLELIIVDDASTDRTFATAEALAEQDGRIVLLRNDCNSGQGVARNKAMRMARGKYITFVDSDDYIFDFLQYGAAQLLHDSDSDFIQFARIERDGAKEIIHRDFDNRLKLIDYGFFNKYMQGGSSWWNPVAKLYRRNFIIDNDLFMPEFIFEDSVFIVQAYSLAKNVIVDPAPLYAQIRTAHAASAMRPLAWTARHARGYFACAAWLSRFMREHKEIGLEHKAMLESRIKQKVQYPHLLKYAASFKNSPVSPFTDEDEANFAAAPELCKAVLEDFADFYVPRHLPRLELSAAAPRQPATRLLTLDAGAGFSFRNNPLLSVIIPVYNVAPYLGKCLDSVLNQNCADAEIILVDDCSTDGSAAIARDYATQYPQIRLFQTEWNTGLGVVRNLAIKEARGAYVTFLDSDDVFDSRFLAAALREIERGGDLVSFSIGYIWPDRTVWEMKPDGEISGFEAFRDHLLSRHKHWGACARLFRLDFLRQHEIVFSKHVYEDVCFMFACYARAKSLRNSPAKSVLSLRTRSTSIMNIPCTSERLFASELHNLRKTCEITRLFGADKAAELRRLYLQWQLEPRHVFYKDFLGYIHCCKRERRPTPLAEDVLTELAAYPGFMGAMLRKYAEMHEESERARQARESANAKSA